MLKDIEGRRALITGSSIGIGAAVARALAGLGAHVAIHGNRNVEAAEALAGEIRAGGGKAVVVIGDVSHSAETARIVDEAVAGLGGLDILINNAGSLIERVTNAGFRDEIFDQVYDLNVRSVLSTTRAAHPYLKASGQGAIVNTGSVAGRFGGFSGSTVYASAKAAVHSITRNAAREFAPDNIRVNTVAPGFITTAFHEATPEAARETARAQIAMGRLGTAEECVGAYLFLVSPAMSGYITGQIIDVNGGQYMA